MINLALIIKLLSFRFFSGPPVEWSQHAHAAEAQSSSQIREETRWGEETVLVWRGCRSIRCAGSAWNL